MSYRVGVCQFEPEFMKLEQNRKKMSQMVSNLEADLIVFPELAISGYTFDRWEEVDQASENGLSGATAELFLKVSSKNNCSYVIGFVEKDENNKIFNSSMLINPDGSAYIYRKTHLFLDEKKFFTPGNSGFKVFPAKDNVKVGMMICFDWIFPESARTLMLNGAQIIAHPANLVLPWCQQAMITRSLENKIFSITANRIGKENNNGKKNLFTGMSQVINENGNVLLRLPESAENTAITNIDPALSDDKYITPENNLISDRHPRLYHS